MQPFNYGNNVIYNMSPPNGPGAWACMVNNNPKKGQWAVECHPVR